MNILEFQLRLGVELFRVLANDQMYLQARDILHYVKNYKDIDLDFVN